VLAGGSATFDQGSRPSKKTPGGDNVAAGRSESL